MSLGIDQSTSVVDSEVSDVFPSQRKALEKGIKDAVSASKKARKVNFKPQTPHVHDEYCACG